MAEREPSPELVAKLLARDPSSDTPTSDELKGAAATLRKGRKPTLKIVEHDDEPEVAEDDETVIEGDHGEKRRAKGRESADGDDVEETPDEGDEDSGEDTDDEGDDEGDDDAPIETIDDLAKGVGVTREQFLAQIKVPGINGEMQPLGRVLEDVREARAGGRLAPQIEREREKYRAELDGFQKERATRFTQLQQLTEQLVSLVETEKVDWAALKESDPNEYLRRKVEDQDLREKRRAAFQRSMQLQFDERKRIEQEELQAAESFKREQGYLIREIARDNPDMGSPDDIANVVGKYLSENFEEDELAGFGLSLYNHKVARTAWKAAQYDRIQAEKRKGRPSAKQRETKPAGRIARPEKQNDTSMRNKKLAGLRARFKQTGHVDDLATVLENRS